MSWLDAVEIPLRWVTRYRQNNYATSEWHTKAWVLAVDEVTISEAEQRRAVYELWKLPDEDLCAFVTVLSCLDYDEARRALFTKLAELEGELGELV